MVQMPRLFAPAYMFVGARKQNRQQMPFNAQHGRAKKGVIRYPRNSRLPSKTPLKGGQANKARLRPGAASKAQVVEEEQKNNIRKNMSAYLGKNEGKRPPKGAGHARKMRHAPHPQTGAP